MGRMHEALRKAAEDRERKRLQQVRQPSSTDVEELENGAPTVEGLAESTDEVPEELSDVAKPVAPAVVAEPDPPMPTETARTPLASVPEAKAPVGSEPTPTTARALLDRRLARERGDVPDWAPPSLHEDKKGKKQKAAHAPAAKPAPKSLVPRRGATPPVAFPGPKHVTGRGPDPRVITFHGPRDPRTEQFRSIRANLFAKKPMPRVILVTSGASGEGKSLALANLATSFVEGTKHRVLVIDCNLRFPELPELLACPESPGLAEFLSGRVLASVCIHATAIPGVDVLPAGDVGENPGAFVVRGALTRVLEDAGTDYDFVLVDSPCLAEFADAAVLAPETDGVIMVVRVEGPSRDHSERALELLDAAQARILGVVATNCR